MEKEKNLAFTAIKSNLEEDFINTHFINRLNELTRSEIHSLITHQKLNQYQIRSLLQFDFNKSNEIFSKSYKKLLRTTITSEIIRNHLLSWSCINYILNLDPNYFDDIMSFQPLSGEYIDRIFNKLGKNILKYSRWDTILNNNLEEDWVKKKWSLLEPKYKYPKSLLLRSHRMGKISRSFTEELIGYGLSGVAEENIKKLIDPLWWDSEWANLKATTLLKDLGYKISSSGKLIGYMVTDGLGRPYIDIITPRNRKRKITDIQSRGPYNYEPRLIGNRFTKQKRSSPIPIIGIEVLRAMCNLGYSYNVSKVIIDIKDMNWNYCRYLSVNSRPNILLKTCPGLMFDNISEILSYNALEDINLWKFKS